MKRASFLVFLFFLVGCGVKSNSQVSDKVLVRFNGTTITEQDFLKKVAGLPPALKNVAMNRKKDLIEDMVAEHFLLKEAERQELNKDVEVRDLIQVAQKKIIIAKLVENQIDQKLLILPDEVSQYYEFNKEEFMTPLLFRASHILLKTESEAQAIKTALDQGADFEETARQKSIDTTAGRGGDLGYFQKGQFVPEFEEQVLLMKKGELRGPVKTQFGYHVIRLNDRVEPRLRDFQSVKKTVEERLTNDRRATLFKELLEKLKGNVKIEIDEQALESSVALSPSS